MRDRHWLRWASVFGLGVVLRLLLWGGYGLGDDPNYFSAYSSIYRNGTYSPLDPYQMRFGIWAPVVVAMKLFGPTEAGFVGAITVASIVNLVLVYLLARQEWNDRRIALVAMLLLAVCPLDVLCAGLFANDMILATYCFAALWVFRRSLRDDVTAAGRTVAAVATGVFLLCAFVAKPWVSLVAPLFVVEAAWRWRARWPSVVTAAASTALCVGAYCAWQWKRFGDPLYHVNVSRPFAIFVPYSREIMLDYVRMLFRPNDYGALFAGYYPHALLVLAALFVRRLGAAGKWLGYTALILAGLTALPAGRVDGRWVTLVPHIFRYLALATLPLCLALTAYARELLCRRWDAGAVLVAGFALLAIVQSVHVTEPTRDAYGEQRRALAFVRAFPDAKVWADGGIGSRFINFELRGAHFERFGSIRSENPPGRAAEYSAIPGGVVITGGARNPWYNCFPCGGNLDRYTPPSTWTLLATFDGARAAYRPEPLRIWRVATRAETKTGPEVGTRP